MFNKMFKFISLFILIIFTIFNSFIEYGEIKESETIYVEVKGDVKKEEVIEIDRESKLIDILDQVELNDDVDLTRYSLNERLHNNQIIVFEQKQDKNKISINNATLDELLTLPGIGEKIAERIIEYRNTYGSFNTIEDIKLVKGIGDLKYEKFKEYICL